MTALTLIIRTVAGILASGLVVLTSLSFLGPMLQRAEAEQHQISADITRLAIKNGIGDVDVRTAEDGERPSATVTSTWGLRPPDVSVRSSGGTTTIDSGCRSGAWPDVCRTRWLIVLPEGTSLDLDQGVGSVTVTDPSGEVRARAGVGEVRVTGSRADTVDVQVGVGGAELELAEAATQTSVRVGVGDVTAEMPADESYSVTFNGMPDTLHNELGDDPRAEHSVSVEAGVGTVRLQGR